MNKPQVSQLEAKGRESPIEGTLKMRGRQLVVVPQSTG